jgi:hypothetical protein
MDRGYSTSGEECIEDISGNARIKDITRKTKMWVGG